jgi:starch phosphorylase
VQACTGALGEDGSDELTAVVTEPMRLVDGDPDAGYTYAADVPLTRAGAAGCTVRVLPAHPLLTAATDLPLVRYPT